jgi:predicted HicB family RNase H-like nuclease
MKEKAIIPVRVFPATHKKLKIMSAKQGKTLAELIEHLCTMSPQTLIR